MGVFPMVSYGFLRFLVDLMDAFLGNLLVLLAFVMFSKVISALAKIL